jgi:hypothetical protein
MLEGDNNRITREKQELEKQNIEKQEEIYTLLERIQKIERELSISNS